MREEWFISVTTVKEEEWFDSTVTVSEQEGAGSFLSQRPWDKNGTNHSVNTVVEKGTGLLDHPPPSRDKKLAFFLSR